MSIIRFIIKYFYCDAINITNIFTYIFSQLKYI